MKNDNNILNQQDDLLSTIKKENNFKTPQNYFDELPGLVNNKRSHNSTLGFNKLLYRLLIPTATFVIIAILLFNLNNTNEIVQISDEQLSEYIINEESEYFDDEIIYESYIENVLTENTLPENEENYINYLIENDIDINNIIEEL